MKLVLGLESDEVIDVPDEAVIEEITSNMEEPELIEEASEEINDYLEVIENFQNIRNHIKKFGITKEFLHLVNTDNQLGKALGIVLPYYEDDDQELEIEEGELPETEVVMESIGENIKKAKDWVIKKWNEMIDFIKNLFNRFMDIFKSYDKKIKQLAAKAEASEVEYDTEKLKSINLNALKEETFKKQWVSLLTALNSSDQFTITLGNADADKIYDLAVPRKVINEGLIFIGKEIERDDSTGNYTYKNTEKGRLFELQKGTAQELGYDKEFFVKFGKGYSEFSETKKAMASIIKNVETGKKKALEILNRTDKDEVRTKDIAGLKNGVKVITKAYSDLIKELIVYTKYVINLGNKFNF